jgi:nucleotide-binding universal stress UspA family protein
MTYASIVVAAAGARDDVAAVSTACDLAKRHRAMISVVIAVPQMASVVGSMAVAGARNSPHAWEGLADSRRQLIDETMAMVREEASRHGLACGNAKGLPCIVTSPQTTNPWLGLQRELPLADLVVTAHSAARGEGPWTGLLAEALMAGRAPVLIACDRARLAGAPAAVAWDGSAEAGRAVRAAVPLLQDASKVVILQDPEGLDTAAGSVADPDRLSRYLAARGIHEVSMLRVKGAKPGPVLLQTAQSLDAAVLVTGAFGHARLAEMIFGGATNTFLHADESLHLFLSH